jgi:hypothetical protein
MITTRTRWECGTRAATRMDARGGGHAARGSMASDNECAIDQTPGRRLAMASNSECYDSYEKDGDDWIPCLAARGGHTHVAAHRELNG